MQKVDSKLLHAVLSVVMGTTFFAVKTVFEHKRCHPAVIVKSPLQQVQYPCWCYFGKWNPAITFDGSQFFPLLITVVNF